MPRKSNGESSIYEGSDAYWHGRVTVGVLDNGKPDRRHVMAKTRPEVARKVRKLEKDRDNGSVRKVGQRWTVASWLEHWVDNIAVPPAVTDSTHSGYAVDVRRHLVPGVGGHRLDKLEPEHLERLYAKMQADGKSPGTAHHVHRTARVAFNQAVRRGYLTGNPAVLASPPKLDELEVEPYDVDEVKRLLKVASESRNSARWAIALALGLRQGEVLGLRWEDVDLDRAVLRVRRGSPRPKYRHGCGDTCGRKPGFCRQKVRANPSTSETKSRAGRRRIGLPDELVELLREHRNEQDAERDEARQLWHDEGWLFANPTGGQLNSNTDYHQWKALLTKAGVRESRLHDARHTAATVLLVLGVPPRTVMAIMGWSSSKMAERYQHVTDSIRATVAKSVGGLLWDSEDEPDEAGPEAK